MPESLERERKLHLDVGARFPHLLEPYAAGPARTFTLTAEYIDTPDLRLLAAGWSLRRRTGGHDAGWHLKSPKVGDARREITAPLAAGATAAHVPRALRAEVSRVVEREPLVPVARLTTRRTERDAVRDGIVVAVVTDDRVSARVPADADPEPEQKPVERWREVEIELAGGTVEDLDAIEALLRGGGAGDPLSGSKIERALHAADTGGEGRAATAGDVVLAHLRRQVGVLQALEGDVRRDLPDAVHQTRVATRRLRSTLRTFRDLLDRTVTDPLAEEVRWLGTMLGGPRDAEILRSRITSDLDAELADRRLGRAERAALGDVADLVRHSLQADHRAAHEVLVTALNSARTTRLWASLVDLLLHPPLLEQADRSPKALRRPIRKAERRVGHALDAALAEPDPAAQVRLMHDVRKRAKAARYAHEAVAHSGTGSHRDERAARWAKRWERVTESLGDYQDTAVAIARIGELALEARALGRDTALHDRLLEREHERGRVSLEAARKALRKAQG